jgi:glycosyltransferase involved in cell wall biosynthesis
MMSPGSLAGGILMTMHRLSQGGADRVGVLLANGFAKAGIPTGLAILRDAGEGEHALLDMLSPGVSLVSAGPPTGSRHLELIRGLGFIQGQVASAKPSVVLASSNNMGLVTGVAARSRRGGGPRYAMKVTNPVVRPRDRGAIRTAYRHRLYGYIFEKYDRILTLTEAERQTLSHLYPTFATKFVTTVNAYISPAMLADYEPSRPSGTPIVLTLARMMPQKRLDLLLRAFAQVHCAHSRLVILGDGPGRPVLEQMARSLGIADRVDMPGFVEDVVPWLRRANLFVLTSDYEGLPAALLEALACNVPVVTTDCFDGCKAMLSGQERCAVVARGDVAAIARAIDASLASTDPPKDLREVARAYGIEASVAAHIRALQPLIGR